MNQFKVGDKVKYKESEKYQALHNGHQPDAIYIVHDLNDDNASVYFEGSPNRCSTHRLELASNNRHKHADLMIAYANDTTLKIQWRSNPDMEWSDLHQQPSWGTNNEYRIKPKTELVKVYNWTMQDMDGYLFISSAKFADTETVKRAYNLIDKLPSTEEEIEIQI